MGPHRIVLELPAGEPGRALRLQARQRGFQRFLLPEGERSGDEDGPGTVYRADDRLIDRQGRVVGRRQSVGSPEQLERFLARTTQDGIDLVEFEGERLIPLENLLSRRTASAELWVRAPTPSSIPGLLGALERGSDAVVLGLSQAGELTEVEQMLEQTVGALTWTEVVVRESRPAGMGERVIVDTTSRLRPDEGLLVGSQAGLLLLALSESEGSRYTRPRAFRVNAGALHSYTLLAEGETRYLDELAAGDRVVISRPNGPARSVRVGRLKVERRPLRLVTVDHDHRSYTLFAQEAETVRLRGTEGPVPVPDLAAGQRLWAVRLPPARHFGQVVDESVEER
jgi:3-dehydroquinate synthase II